MTIKMGFDTSKVKNSRENTIYINMTSNVYNGESNKGLFRGLIQPMIKKKWKVGI